VARTTYVAYAEWDGEWWAIDVPQVIGGASRARAFKDIEGAARRALALQVRCDSFDVVVVTP